MVMSQRNVEKGQPQTGHSTDQQDNSQHVQRATFFKTKQRISRLWANELDLSDLNAVNFTIKPIMDVVAAWF